MGKKLCNFRYKSIAKTKKMKYNETNVTCQVFNIVFYLANVAFARQIQ